MALPPKGDPRRPLHLAIRSTRVLGVVLLLFGTCAFFPYMMSVSRVGAAPGAVPPAWTLIMVAMFYFVPGTLFLVFAIFLGRRQLWAVVSALVLSSLMEIFFLLGLFGLAVTGLSSFGRGNQVAFAIAVAVMVLFCLAVGQLIYHLAKSFEAIKHPPFGQEIRGFEPLPVRPIVVPQAPIDPTPPANA